jgi:hypothetical protein
MASAGLASSMHGKMACGGPFRDAQSIAPATQRMVSGAAITDHSARVEVHPMQLPRAKEQQQEPIGIVIADGGPGDSLPKFSAFVWGPVPDDLELMPSEAELAAVA